MENAFFYMRHIVLFFSPVILLIFLFFILISIYLVHPYTATKDFIETLCKVQQTQVSTSIVASCSAGTDQFQPCVQVYVSYLSGMSATSQSAVIMENEQALLNCNQCSYSFGRHSLFYEKNYICEDWKENFAPQACLETFIERYGKVNQTYNCFFNPDDHSQVVRYLQTDLNKVVQSCAWSLFICVLYVVICALVFYNKAQKRLLNKIYIGSQRNLNSRRHRVADSNSEKTGRYDSSNCKRSLIEFTFPSSVNETSNMFTTSVQRVSYGSCEVSLNDTIDRSGDAKPDLLLGCNNLNAENRITNKLSCTDLPKKGLPKMNSNSSFRPQSGINNLTFQNENLFSLCLETVSTSMSTMVLEEDIDSLYKAHLNRTLHKKLSRKSESSV